MCTIQTFAEWGLFRVLQDPNTTNVQINLSWVHKISFPGL